jgi:hypothetical protein
LAAPATREHGAAEGTRRTAHDEREQPGRFQRIAIAERQRGACHIGERHDSDEPDEL